MGRAKVSPTRFISSKMCSWEGESVTNPGQHIGKVEKNIKYNLLNILTIILTSLLQLLYHYF